VLLARKARSGTRHFAAPLLSERHRRARHDDPPCLISCR
jgi:hypothetical protein